MSAVVEVTEGTGTALDAGEVGELYDAVGWSAYTRDLPTLLRGLAGSHTVLLARSVAAAPGPGGRLVGLVRTLSDGATACYVQDLLVHPDARRLGVGRALLEEVRRRYAGCRFLGLTTDASGPDAQVSHPFYRALGFVPHGELGLAAFARDDR